MSQNPFAAGVSFPAAALNSVASAPNQTGFTSVSVTTGGNAYEVDVAGDVVYVDGEWATVSSATLTLDSPDADNDRVDLVVVDNTGTPSAVTGTPASEQDADGNDQPIDPDIPADAALAATVYVRAGASEILSGDISDEYATNVEPPYKPPLLGDGSDGDVVKSADETVSGPVYARDYTVEGGVTLSVDGALVIFATGTVTIEGTIDATGGGGSGGSADSSSAGGPGADAGIYPTQAGGSGGSGGSTDNDGGAGGTGDDAPHPRPEVFRTAPDDVVTDVLRLATPWAGAGGGGGGFGDATAGSDNEASGSNGSFPGGGGGGSYDDTTDNGAGGAGGNGGGLVVVICRELAGSGSILADGTDGADGVGDSSTAPSGGGGGGSGGFIGLVRSRDSSSLSTSVAAGTGGAGGSYDTESAGDGADGAAGAVRRLSLSLS